MNRKYLSALGDFKKFSKRFILVTEPTVPRDAAKDSESSLKCSQCQALITDLTAWCSICKHPVEKK